MALCSLLNCKIATEIFVSRNITKDVMCIINSHRHPEWLHTLKKGINLLTKVTREKTLYFWFWEAMNGVIYHDVIYEIETINTHYYRQFESLH